MPWERKTVEEQRNEFAEAATPLCSPKTKQAPHKPYFRAFAELAFSFFTFGGYRPNLLKHGGFCRYLTNFARTVVKTAVLTGVVFANNI